MKKLVIMAGLPGSGKSTVRLQKYNSLDFVDCDEIKKTIPGYDPKNPDLVHEQSKAIERKLISEKINSGVSFVYDTTASNIEKIIKMVIDAQSLGYEVEVCYVKVKLATAIYRNAHRERVVPEEIIREKYSVMSTAIDIFSGYVDKLTIVNND